MPLRRRCAFTFLEIIIVIVIMSVLLVVVLPRFSGPRERMALRSAARDLAAAGLLARQMAIVQGETASLVIDPAAKSWRLELPLPPEVDRRGRIKRERDPGISQDEQPRDFPERVHVEQVRIEDVAQDGGGPHVLRFYPNGGCTGAAIQFANTRGRSLTVEFTASTGRPEVYEGEPKSLAKKLAEAGLDPAQYGLYDESLAGKPEPSEESFKKTAGWNEEERSDYYADVADRIAARAKARYASAQEGGPGAYYSDAAKWGR